MSPVIEAKIIAKPSEFDAVNRGSLQHTPKACIFRGDLI